MLAGAFAFNQPLSFDTSSVTNMGDMFYYASAFNQPLSSDTSSVTTMGDMFNGAGAFNQPLSFDTSSVTDMSYMFFVRSSPCPTPNLQSSPPLACTLRAPRSPASKLAPRPAPYVPSFRLSAVRVGV